MERLHQLVRQTADQTDCINQHHPAPVRQVERAGGRVQRRKQHILCQHARIGQGVEQGGFAHVGVAHDGNRHHVVLLPALAQQAAAFFQCLQLLFQRVYPAADVSAVTFQLAFAGTAGADAAAQTGKAGALSCQTRQTVLQLRQLHL